MHLAALTQSPAKPTRRTRQWHRHNWPETDVGAGLLAKRRAGGARSQGRRKNQGMHLAALTQSPGGQSRRTRQWHRHNWPETDVGAGLLAKRRAGGARSQGRRRTQAMHLAALTQSPAKPTRRTRQWHRHNWPETDVGAELAREAPRGRRTVSRALQNHRLALGGHDEISSGALRACHEIASWPLGACLGFSSALETVRRPRGASRASSAPTSVSGQLCLCHCLVRLVGLAGDWVRASRCMPWFFRRPRDRAPPARRFASKPAPTSVSGQLCLGDCLDRLVFPA